MLDLALTLLVVKIHDLGEETIFVVDRSSNDTEKDDTTNILVANLSNINSNANKRLVKVTIWVNNKQNSITYSIAVSWDLKQEKRKTPTLLSRILKNWVVLSDGIFREKVIIELTEVVVDKKIFNKVGIDVVFMKIVFRIKVKIYEKNIVEVKIYLFWGEMKVEKNLREKHG